MKEIILQLTGIEVIMLIGSMVMVFFIGYAVGWNLSLREVKK